MAHLVAARTAEVADSARAFWQYTEMFTSSNHVFFYLHELGLFHMDLTLERMHRALTHLGLSRPPFAVIQVVGTNGKGSTSTFLSELARAHGHRTGLYTSPHFVNPSERILCQGCPLPEHAWPTLAKAVHKAEPKLTYFEFLTVLAVLAFAEAKVEIAVLEAGLGGRWDATSAVPSDVLCISPIGIDHEKVLGSTLSAIATDKTGAMRAHVPVVHAPQQPEVLAVLREQAQLLQAPLYAANALAPLPATTALSLRGPHQAENARLALAVWRHLSALRQWAHAPEAEDKALRAAFIPGRFQHIEHGGHSMILDGAHNAHGLLALRDALCADNIKPRVVIFSCLADKNLDNILPLLRDIVGEAPLYIPTIADNERAMPGETLAARVGPNAQAVPGLAQALHLALPALPAQRPSGPVLLCGSLYLLGEFFTLYPEFLQPPLLCEDI